MLKPLFALSLFASASAVYPQSIPSVAVFMNFETRPAERSVAEMKREVQNLLQPSGLHIDWRQLSEAGTESTFADVFVFRFRGRCHMDQIQLLFSELGPYGEAVVMGQSRTVDSQIQSFGSLECDPIRRTIAPEVLGLANPEREAVLGRALGRVLAHELYHMMTGAARHAQTGVFKASHRKDELTAKQFLFEAREQRELRRVADKLSGRSPVR